MACDIHSTAIVDKAAELGEDVSVGPYSIVGPHVRIGDRTKIGPHAVLSGHTVLGADNVIFQFASVGSAPQDLKYKNEPTTLEIGSRNTIREYVTLNPGTITGLRRTVIGDDNLFMVSSHVAHDCVVGNSNVFANSVALAGHVFIGNYVILGGLVAVHQFNRVGDYAFLSGGAMVTDDIPPYCMGQGDRAELRGLNLVGLKRAGFSETDVAEVKKAYRYLFATRGSLEKKLASFPAELGAKPRVKFMLDFIANSKRGVSLPQKTMARL